MTILIADFLIENKTKISKLINHYSRQGSYSISADDKEDIFSAVILALWNYYGSIPTNIDNIERILASTIKNKIRDFVRHETRSQRDARKTLSYENLVNESSDENDFEDWVSFQYYKEEKVNNINDPFTFIELERLEKIMKSPLDFMFYPEARAITIFLNNHGNLYPLDEKLTPAQKRAEYTRNYKPFIRACAKLAILLRSTKID
jgi:hypothetical protein